MQVHLNVYHIAKVRYSQITGLGLYHSTIEINSKSYIDLEYSFGKSSHDETGVYCVESGSISGLDLYQRYYLGVCEVSLYEIEVKICELKKSYQGSDYHLILKNCNHFSDELAL